MSPFSRQVLAVLWKDLRTEARTKERLSAMCFFALLVLLIFNFALSPEPQARGYAAAGVFWIAVTFAGLFGLSRSFALERENDCLMGLLLTPADRGAIYLGKTLANLVTMAIVEIAILPLIAVFLNVTVLDHVLRLLPILILGTVGFAAVGTLFAAMSINTRLQEALLPLLTLPVLVPALISAVESFRAVLEGEPLSEITQWLKLSAAFALLFLAACTLLFDYVVEE
jgi:heme exporter protein B